MSCKGCPPYEKDKSAIIFPRCFQWIRGACTKKNPGNVENLHGLSRNVMPKFFDGLELDYMHRLGPHKYITGSWILSHMKAAGFRFGGLYTFRFTNDVLLTPTIIGDIHPSTQAANLNILYYPYKCLRLEATLQRSSEKTPVDSQYTIELTRPCDTWSANFYNVRMDNGRCTLSVMRAITQHWALGGEMLLEWNSPEKLSTDFALAARYSHHHFAVAASASRIGLDISYWQRIYPQIQMANLLAYNYITNKTIATVGYQWNFSDSAVHAMLDSDASVGFMWTKYLNNFPLQMGLSVIMSIPTDRFAFGMRFVVDPSGYRRDN
ncbi:mitochondrial import receptor subunit TOM40 homolog [Drosophila miranda]|uniref:mitochondrial import receptor subunit TOM40 homolog n=1 Tax=Drosophila miranda TaxID=7229 RepID=UPI0007E78C64|nr:mitochondrial import receptor subunit TOM40 homolog [Drosophila miranda]